MCCLMLNYLDFKLVIACAELYWIYCLGCQIVDVQHSLDLTMFIKVFTSKYSLLLEDILFCMFPVYLLIV